LASSANLLLSRNGTRILSDQLREGKEDFFRGVQETFFLEQAKQLPFAKIKHLPQ
jgi:hypothetical protein